MAATETNESASYSKALKAVSNAMTQAKLDYKLIGPEVITPYHLEKYAKAMDLSLVHAVAHHNYICHPGSCNTQKKIYYLGKQLKSAIQKPLMMTEYWTFSWMETAIILHNSLTVENVVAYIYWGIPWPMGKRGIGTRGHPCTMYLFCLCSPPGSKDFGYPCTGSDDYKVNHLVYVLMQYARFVRPGWKRVHLAATGYGPNVLASAFKDPSGSNFTVVMINTANEETSVTLDGISIKGTVYQTDANQAHPSQSQSKCENVGAYKPGDILKIPGQSITTVNGLFSSSTTSRSSPALVV